MKNEGTRNVSPEMMKAMKIDGAFFPFIDFTRDNKELALCFRGNDSQIGKVVIYRNNHVIWELTIVNGCPRVSVSMDHARFMYDWIDYAIKGLMDLGFRSSNKMEFDEIKKEKGFAVRRWSENDGYTYHSINLYYCPLESEIRVKDVVEKSYEILKKMQDVYFCTDNEQFRKINSKSEKHKGEGRPINYIKEYYFENHSDSSTVDLNHKLYSKLQKCVEKHVQQELFIHNHEFVDGVFVYDLEFAQPTKEGIKVERKNKPDMFGIRFDSNGNMVAICMIEVKSTKSALNQKSGLKKHLEGMESYIDMRSKDGYLMDDRKIEAYRILNQYKDIGFYGVENQYKEEDFLNLKTEIIFIFSGEVKDLNTQYKDKVTKEYVTIGDVLADYEPYDGMHSGSYTGEITVLRKQYD